MPVLLSETGSRGKVAAMPDEQNQLPLPPTTRIIESEDYRDVYSNSTNVRVSLFDFHLSFGTMDPPSAEGPSMTMSAGVFLSPQQAKALLNVLAQNIRGYEQQFGEIKLRPDAGLIVPGVKM